jgi:hypothetical protein
MKDQNGQSSYPSNFSIEQSNGSGRILRGGAGIEARKSMRYRDILSGIHLKKDHGSPVSIKAK